MLRQLNLLIRSKRVILFKAPILFLRNNHKQEIVKILKSHLSRERLRGLQFRESLFILNSSQPFI